jgi:hypothetical protein
LAEKAKIAHLLRGDLGPHFKISEFSLHTIHAILLAGANLPADIIQ